MWGSSPESTQISSAAQDLFVTFAGDLGRGSNEKRLWGQTVLCQAVKKLLSLALSE